MGLQDRVKLSRIHFILLCFILFIFLLHQGKLSGDEIEKMVQEGLQNGVTVDLREPTYVNGVLTTEKGGIISASQLRIQAMRIQYTKQTCEGGEWSIEAEGKLIVEFGDYIFVGEKLYYNFKTKEGVIEEGKTGIEPWYFGGKKFELKSDGSYIIHDGYVTTSEKDHPDWGIYSDLLIIEPENTFKAKNIKLHVFNYTVLWLPSLQANLSSIIDSPIRYRFRWGGRQGPRIGLTYEVFSWERWKTFIRFDYRLTRGPGGGIETRYCSEDKLTQFQSINYLAKDSSILHPNEKARYRFEGAFRKSMDDQKTKILLTYDKISDKDMPSNYYDRDFEFDTSERTQLLIRREEKDWIGNFYSRIRINSFQTVKQQLPSLGFNYRPFEIKNTGIIFENWANASYLNFEYSKYLMHVKNYSSTRFDYRPTLYRPFTFKPYFTLTPELGIVAVFYGNTPHKDRRRVILGKGGLNLQTQLHCYYHSFKHVIEPYAYYKYYSSPTSSPHDHYIFDMSDGLTRLNYLTFGINQSFYLKNREAINKRIFTADCYTYAFFNTDKICQTIPKIYGHFVFFTFPTLRNTIDMAWNIEHSQLDFINFHTEWTASSDLAISTEYRYRGPYYWRKIDQENFFLDMFRSENQLLHSPVSDRRDTFLIHLFYPFHPNWACEVTTRQGWNRKNQPRYTEFEIDVLTTVQTAWHLRFSYQHQENDDRLALFLNIGLSRPNPIDVPNSTRSYSLFE